MSKNPNGLESPITKENSLSEAKKEQLKLTTGELANLHNAVAQQPQFNESGINITSRQATFDKFCMAAVEKMFLNRDSIDRRLAMEWKAVKASQEFHNNVGSPYKIKYDNKEIYALVIPSKDDMSKYTVIFVAATQNDGYISMVENNQGTVHMKSDQKSIRQITRAAIAPYIMGTYNINDSTLRNIVSNIYGKMN